MQAVYFKKALGCEGVGVLDMGAGSGLLSMMAARYKHATNPPFCVTKKKKKTTQAVISKINREKH
jgi:predicted RNA methylase